MSLRQTRVMIFPVLMLALFLVGCPKRPATSPVAAPAPTGAPSAGPPPSTPGVEAQPTGPVTGGPGAVAVAPGAPTNPPLPKEFSPTEALKAIHFDFDKYDIRPDDAKILDGDAKWMKANANYLILIEGHCDERGTNEYNLALGERRAKSTINYLVAQGVQASRMTLISYGKERPLCTEHNEACWAKNRRAHFLVKAE